MAHSSVNKAHLLCAPLLLRATLCMNSPCERNFFPTLRCKTLIWAPTKTKNAVYHSEQWALMYYRELLYLFGYLFIFCSLHMVPPWGIKLCMLASLSPATNQGLALGKIFVGCLKMLEEYEKNPLSFFFSGLYCPITSHFSIKNFYSSSLIVFSKWHSNFGNYESRILT